MRHNLILEIYKKNQTVFTTKDFSLFFPEVPYHRLKRKLSYYVKTGKISHLKRGVYAKENFDALELANKIYAPSYISLETVLRKEGVVFQESSVISVVSYLTREISCGGVKIYYRKIKDEILINKRGITAENNYFLASKERAFLDAVFLYKNYHFDNLAALNWKRIFDLAGIYQSKILHKRVNDYYQIFQRENVRQK